MTKKTRAIIERINNVLGGTWFNKDDYNLALYEIGQSLTWATYTKYVQIERADREVWVGPIDDLNPWEYDDVVDGLGIRYEYRYHIIG